MLRFAVFYSTWMGLATLLAGLWSGFIVRREGANIECIVIVALSGAIAWVLTKHTTKLRKAAN